MFQTEQMRKEARCSSAMAFLPSSFCSQQHFAYLFSVAFPRASCVQQGASDLSVMPEQVTGKRQETLTYFTELQAAFAVISTEVLVCAQRPCLGSHVIKQVLGETAAVSVCFCSGFGKSLFLQGCGQKRLLRRTLRLPSSVVPFW